ncbi:MAG: phage holin family protein [Flavobacteriaceae bacterium]|nr:phage holin family protein [Flavobacteriaceae bacterium]
MIDLLRKYIDNRLQLIKLELISALANVASGLISSFLLMGMAMFILLMFNFALAYYLGSVFENQALGFLAVGLIYVILFAIYFLFGRRAIDKNVKDKIVRSIFAADQEIKGENGYDVYEDNTNNNY